MYRASTEIFRINSLQVWFVHIESRIESPKDATQTPLQLFLLLLEDKGVVCPVHCWFQKL